MTEQAWWVVAIVVVILVGVISFFIGRKSAEGKERIEALESEVSRQKAEISDYKKDVETHFDKTATLFVSMAGSYKDLFEHLSSGYEKLSEGSARELFQQRVTSLLLEGTKDAADAKDATDAKGDNASLSAGDEKSTVPDDVAAADRADTDTKVDSSDAKGDAGESADTPADAKSGTSASAEQTEVAPPAEASKDESPKEDSPKDEARKDETLKDEAQTAGEPKAATAEDGSEAKSDAAGNTPASDTKRDGTPAA